MFREAKYLAAYTLPLVTVLAIFQLGWWSYATLIEAFVIIPLLELVLPKSRNNVPETAEPSLLKQRFFDYLLYLMAPVQYAILGFFLWRVTSTPLEGYELTGLILSMGIQCGAIGINVAHELGHRPSRFERLLAKSLLLSSLYMHFIVEHNHGHHRHVATLKDPATARFGEAIYLFWPRTVFGSFFSALRIESTRLAKEGKSTFSLQNDVVLYSIIQLILCASIYAIFNGAALLAFFGAAAVGILLLETVNYIEHYGLLREKTEAGRYERVQPRHSWNSDHSLGRIVLFELTRHSDHHYKASRKYQLLRHMPDSPQLPTGYPGAMLLALVPPLWFWVVNPLVKAQSER